MNKWIIGDKLRNQLVEALGHLDTAYEETTEGDALHAIDQARDLIEDITKGSEEPNDAE